MSLFKKATKEAARLRLALVGPSGSGKTMTALKIAQELAASEGLRIAVIDTEHGSASKYADLFDFDAAELSSFDPSNYVNHIADAEKAGYGVLIIDSLSHAWSGKDGALEQVDRAKARSNGNGFAAWRDVTPKHNELVDAMIRAGMHVIVTMRAKTDYVMEEYEEGGKKKSRPVKVGLAPIQRDGVEYEFDVVADLDVSNHFVVSKTRCSELAGKVYHQAGKEVASVLKEWLRGERPTEDERRHFHALGTELYGKEWNAKRHELNRAVTQGRTEHTEGLTRSEVRRLIAGLEQKRDQSLQMIADPAGVPGDGASTREPVTGPAMGPAMGESLREPAG